MRRSRISLLVLMAATSIVACDVEPVGPSTFRSGPLEVTAEVVRARLTPGDSAVVRVVFRNRGDAALEVGMSAGCPFFLAIVDRSSGDPVRMGGADYVCTAALSAFEIPAGDSAVFERPVVAEVGGVDLEAGEYEARLDFTTATPALKAPFTVR